MTKSSFHNEVFVSLRKQTRQQPLELVQPGKGALDDPAVAAEAGAVLGLAPRDLRCDPAPTKLATVAGIVVAAVGAQPRRPPSRPADLAAHRRHACKPLAERLMWLAESMP